MKKNIFRLSLVLFFAVVTVGSTYADYLVVSRNAIIKAEPVKKGAEVERARRGDTLNLLDEGVQVSGYYHVLNPKSGNSGWIYRTLARRYERIEPVATERAPVNCDPDNPPSIDIEHTSAMPDGYYNAVDDLNGNALKSGLNGLIDNHTEFPYTSTGTDVWDILKETDKVPGCPDFVKLLYTNRMRPAGEEYNSGKGWTREHVWAKSHGGFGTSKGAGTDAHHLRPVDASVNSTRNNKDFDNGGEEYMDGEY
ncbi:MAG: endonuclease, partial [Flavobacteriales bacterium]|nr:endonuclease [Flavobacteriales bacterium]